MKQTLWTTVSFGVALALSAVAANAFTLTGTVKDESGKAVQDASVSLINNKLDTKTDAEGKFSFQKEDVQSLDMSASGMVGSLSVNNGVLSYSQSSSAPVQVQIFDMMGNRLLNETLYGTGSVDMKSSVNARGVYMARVRVGSAQQNFKFTADGSFRANFGDKTSAKALLKLSNEEKLRVVKEGFDTLTINWQGLFGAERRAAAYHIAC